MKRAHLLHTPPYTLSGEKMPYFPTTTILNFKLKLVVNSSNPEAKIHTKLGISQLSSSHGSIHLSWSRDIFYQFLCGCLWDSIRQGQKTLFFFSSGLFLSWFQKWKTINLQDSSLEESWHLCHIANVTGLSSPAMMKIRIPWNSITWL